MTSFIFPGQGSQSVGMSKDFHDNFQIAKRSFEEIEDYTSINIRSIIFENNTNKLNLTKYTQICIFASSYAIFKTYEYENNLKIKDINVMMGHSLGEYSALTCSYKIELRDCALILKKRGELMNDAVPPNETGMAALIGKNSDEIQKIIYKNNLNVEIANDNSEIQIVISGKIDDLTNSKAIFLNNDVKKFILLNVSSAFHSNFMVSAQKELSEEIEKLSFKENKIKIISNFDANIYDDTMSIKKNLKYQMANKVNWTKSVKKLEQIGENQIIEIGPSKVLSGLIKRISNNFDIISIDKIADIK
tara:strand:- start:489 stop:1400 length:912 start_codon:yes stop_codon:yes gene_type:complete